jgi:hypothetical protein
VPIGTVLSNDSSPAIVQDVDGTQLTIGLTGPGHWQVVEGASGPQLTVTATDPTSQVSLQTTGGNGRFTLFGVELDAPLKSIAGSSVDLSGDLTATGAVNSIILGNVTGPSHFALQGTTATSQVNLGLVQDLTVGAAAPISTFAVQGWNAGTSAPDELDAPSLGTFSSQGDIHASLALSGQGVTGLTLTSASAKGALADGLWYIVGRAGTISAGSVAASWTGDITGPVNQVTTTGDFDGQLATPSLQFLTVGGSLVGARLYIGADFGPDGQLGGIAGSDHFGSGVLAHLRVTGMVTNSHIWVGVDPKDGVFDNGNDVIIGGASSQIQQLIIGGAINSPSRIEAGLFPSSVTVGGKTISPTTLAQLGIAGVDTVAPNLAAGLLNDAGVSATDHLTNDDTVAGSVSDTGGLSSLRGGLDGIPVANYANLLSLVQPDGSFVASAALLQSLAGGSIAEGAHTLHLVATDSTGNSTSLDVAFVLDTVPPAAPSFDLAPAFETGVPGDHTTNFAAVSLAGATESNAVVILLPPNFATTADGAGAFRFDNIALALGANAFTARAVDAAGNHRDFAVTITRVLGTPITATSGTPANAGQASANPGQIIGMSVPFDPTTAFATFHVIGTDGTQSTRDVQVTSVDFSKGIAFFQVPYDVVTNDVVVYSKVGNTRTDFAGGAFTLQIVPVVSSIDVTSVAADGSSAQVTLTGLGFIEDNGSAYQFGSTAIVDSSVSTGPDVAGGLVANGAVNLVVPLSAGAFGAITVTTAGGTSAPLSFGLTGIVSTALSGTPANASVASANPGQAITLAGSGLSTASDILLRYLDSTGVQQTVLLNPTAAAVNGTSATLIVPDYANGVTALQMLGASGQPLLQIVPVVSGYNVNGTNTLQLFGSGFQEGSASNTVSYNFAGATVSDTSSSSGADVSNANGAGHDNNAVLLTEPVHGLGNVTVTTAGGTSAPLSLNELETGDGLLRDVAFDPSNPNQLWVADNANPAVIHLIDATTGQQIRSITLSAASFGASTFFGGLQVVPSTPAGQTPLTLNGVLVPAGSLLLFDGATNPDRVIAVNATTGAVLSTLILTKNYDMTAGVYDPFSGHLLIVDRSTGANPNQIVAINPSTGAEIANSRFNLPFNAGEAGLVLDPAHNGTFWYGSDQSTSVVQLSATGTVLQSIDLSPQGIDDNEIDGLAFDNNGKLRVASSRGVVYRVSV